jgi:hypothetical protein
MRNFLERFCRRFPVLYLLVIGGGGAALIIVALMSPLYLIGGKKMMNSIGSIPSLLAGVWMFGVYLKARRHFGS